MHIPIVTPISMLYVLVAMVYKNRKMLKIATLYKKLQIINLEWGGVQKSQIRIFPGLWILYTLKVDFQLSDQKQNLTRPKILSFRKNRCKNGVWNAEIQTRKKSAISSAKTVSKRPNSISDTPDFSSSSGIFRQY